MFVLAIIPARGGSKGIPRKNLRPLVDKPLVLHSIEHASQARLIDQVVVSTDDQEIASIADRAGATVVWRPASLATDSAPTTPVLLHVLEQWTDHEPDKIVTLQPTSPLRTPGHVDAAIEALTEDFDSVIGVCETEHSPYKMYLLEADTLRPLLGDSGIGRPRQELPVVFRENGAVYVTWRSVLQEQRSIWGRRPRPFVMDTESSVDIDNTIDLALADLLLRQRN